MWAESVVWRGWHLVSHGVTIVYVDARLCRGACSAKVLSSVSALGADGIKRSGASLSLIDDKFFTFSYTKYEGR